MAVRFAVANNSLWSSGGTWDNGSVPVTGDDVHANGFTVILDQDITVGSLRNTTSQIYLPNMSIPLMTSNSTPYGNVIASTDTTNAWKVFDQDSSTTWGPTANITGWIGYQFTAATIIKRFYYVGNSIGYNASTFQGSLDNITWDTIHIIPNGSGSYLSPVLTSTTAYNYYRLNIGGVQFGQAMFLNRLEMTETTGTTYGATAGGTFTVPSTLVGTRTITQNGSGIITNTSSNGIITLFNTSGNTVNFNVTDSGLIFSQQWSLTTGAASGIVINGAGTVNFNGILWGNQNSFGTTNGNIFVNANAKINVNGDLYAAKNTGAVSPVINLAVTNSNGAVVNINGNIIDSTAVANLSSPIIISSLATVNISGNVTSNLSNVIQSSTACVVNIPFGTISVTNSNSVPAISMSSGLLTVNGPIINVGNASAILVNKMRFYSGQTAQWTVQDTTNANITLSSISSSGITIGLPLSGDVRYLTTYGQNNEYVGSLRVPSVDNVRKGVPTDFTVGTADLTANDIFNAISGSSNSVAVRLRNVSTVQSAGDQIAGLS